MRILIIGLGSIGRKHVNILKELRPTAEIIALRSNITADQADDIRNIYSYEEIPDDISFFLIANPTSFHQEAIGRLLKFNKPLFIEKPVLHILNEESYNILQTIRGKKLFTYIACPLRFHPCIEFLKNFLNEEHPRINEITVYCGSFLPDWRPGKNFREVYSSRPELGGGVHLDLIHELDYTYFLFGKPSRVIAELRSKSSLKIPAIDHAHYYLDYDDFTVNITLNYYRTEPKRSVELVFENTIWTVDLNLSTIIDEKGNIIFSRGTNASALLKKQMTVFLEDFNKGIPSINSFEESIEVLKICLNQDNWKAR